MDSITSVIEAWPEYDLEKRRETFHALARSDAEDLFLRLAVYEQVEILEGMSGLELRPWVRLLALDDTADLIQALPDDHRSDIIALLDPQTRIEVLGLLAYAEDKAGGLMNPQYLRLRPEMTAEAAIRYLRAQARTPIETIYYAYVMDSFQKLNGVISFRDLLLASPQKLVEEIMTKDFLYAKENTDQEEVARILSSNNLMAIPVITETGEMKGIITYDDVVTAVQTEATEDMQKFSGMEALDAPYFKVSFLDMIRKRAGWLTILFIGEMFTATAMSFYEKQIEKLVLLAIFIPLIISSGGNSGSQASTLIIRSLALREIGLRDWFKVMRRELASGLMLGLILGIIGFARIIIWQYYNQSYGEHYLSIATSVSLSLVGVVLFGTLSGSMLPFVLKKVGFDPASASAPFVATLVDVTGLVIYFSISSALIIP
ncbi:MAG: magnesium transporter [Bacteriovoracaceae bacterium]|nr:magnesium transporter [Bacteriovoracaceae bacterium]